MTMELTAAAILSGMVGYAIGKDGKLQPISQAQINRLLQDTKPVFLEKVAIDTSIARNGTVASGEYGISGSFLLVLNPTTPTNPVYIKLNEPTWPELPLTDLRRIIGPFYRFFIKNTAGSGTLNLVVSRGFQFQLVEKEVAATVSLKLDSLVDTYVPSPGDLYIFYWSNADQEWRCRAFTDWLHKTAHQDGGADEISIAGLAGSPADTVNKTGAQTVAGVKTFSSIIVLPGTDPTTANQAVRKAYADLFTLLTTFNDHKARHQDGGGDELSIAGLAGEPADVVAKSLFNAYTLLAADTDNTPAAITLAASQLIGRKATGGIVALTATDIRTILNVADGADVTGDNAPQAHNQAASTITSGRFPVDRLPAMADEKIWKGTGANVEEVDIPVGVPSGFIGMWHGTIATIPSGYVICDGNNSTPNLLTRFVEGVATAATNPGTIGGEATHTLTEAEMPAHGHSYTGVLLTNRAAGDPHDERAGSTSRTSGSVGGGGTHENKPPFYDVAFLMKT